MGTGAQQLCSAHNVDGITVTPTGGVDQYVDWSQTAPQRTQARPPDEEGDSVFVVSPVLELVSSSLFWVCSVYLSNVSVCVSDVELDL